VSPEEVAELRLLRRCTIGGPSIGGQGFLEEMEDWIGGKWWRWPVEKAPGGGSSRRAVRRMA